MSDTQLPDGSVKRTDPRTGKSRVISRADYDRTVMTRERDDQHAGQAGAPPIASGNVGQASAPVAALPRPAVSPYQTKDRRMNVERAKADGQFDSIRATYNASNKGTEMDQEGIIFPKMAVEQERASTPSMPKADGGMANIAVAAGPNISTAPTGLPAGSVGRYNEKTKAWEVDPRLPAPAPAAQPAVAPLPAPVAPRQDAAPDAASQAWAENSAGRGGPTVSPQYLAPAPANPVVAQAQPPAPAPAAPAAQPAAPLPRPAPVAAPVPTPAVVDMTPAPAATPVNAPASIADSITTGVANLATGKGPFAAIGENIQAGRAKQKAREAAARTLPRPKRIDPMGDFGSKRKTAPVLPSPFLPGATDLPPLNPTGRRRASASLSVA